ncbi:MAG: hypothetical protein HZC41_02955 [Chloroflexi bacterium]|nr:hypothetical protein [Chloroflexota bacterium]
MIEQLLNERWLPGWMRRSHPLVRHALHRRASGELRYVVFGSAVGLFMLFGGLSLPILYLFLWLAILVQQALVMAGRLHEAQVKQVWPVLRVTPFSARELLLTTWAGSFWQLNQSWVMGLYRLLQGMAVIGLMVFGLWFADFPVEHAALVLVAGLAAIAFQPLAETYLSGMIGLLCAGLLRRQVGALALAVLLVLVYWCACFGIVAWAVFGDTDGLSLAQLLTALILPSLLPLALGYGTLRLAERRIRASP